MGISTHCVVIILGAGIGLLAFVILNNWRSGFYLFLIWMIFEDLPRKYLGNNMIIYFGKDVLVSMVYLAFFFAVKRGRVQTFRPPFLFPLYLFVWWGILQVFNPNSPSIIYGFVGIKLFFYYIPLMFLGYALIRTREDLKRFLIFNLSVATIVALLGIAHALVGPNFLNPPKLSPELQTLGRLYRTAPLSGMVVYRPTSVFVSDGRFAWYMLLAFLLGFGTLGFLALQPNQDRTNAWAALSLGIVVAAIVLSGSRGTFVHAVGSTLILFAGFLWGNQRSWKSRFRVSHAMRQTLFATGIGLVTLVTLFPKAVGANWAFYYETIAPWSPRSELLHRVRDYPLANFLAAFSYPSWFIGYGLGTASLGRQYITSIFKLPSPKIGVESGYGTLVLEMGILGLLLWIAWTSVLIYSGWQIIRELRETSLFPLGLSVFWFIFLLLFPMTFGGIQPYQNFIFNAYLWLLVGILFRLPKVVCVKDNE